MNILFVIGSLEIGGAQTFVIRLANYLAEKGHKIFIYNVHPSKENKEIINLLNNKVKLIRAYYENIEQKLSSASPLLLKVFHRLFNRYKVDSFFLKRFIKKENIHIINSHLYLADLYISKLKLCNIPKISTWHGCYNLLLEDYQTKQKLDELINNTKTIFKDYKKLILITDRQKEVYQILKINIPYKKIYNGFSLPSKISPIKFNKGNSFIFGMIARGDKTKGWEEAITAFLLLKQKTDKPVKLILVGWSEYLQQLSEKYKDQDIIFARATDNPLGCIYHFDVGLLPTYFPAESLPNTIIEYLAMGKPVIATRWAEIPQMIDSHIGPAGFLIDIINGLPDIEQLAKYMLVYINNSDILDKHTKAARRAFEKFSMKKCADSYIQLFSRLNN